MSAVVYAALFYTTEAYCNSQTWKKKKIPQNDHKSSHLVLLTSTLTCKLFDLSLVDSLKVIFDLMFMSNKIMSNKMIYFTYNMIY